MNYKQFIKCLYTAYIKLHSFVVAMNLMDVSAYKSLCATSHQPIPMFLARTPSHPTKAHEELRKRLRHIPLSGQCHYTLISSFIAKENTQPVHWRGHQRFRAAILRSPEMDHSLKKRSWWSSPSGREMFPSLICVSPVTRFPPGGHVLREKTSGAPLQRFHALSSTFDVAFEQDVRLSVPLFHKVFTVYALGVTL